MRTAVHVVSACIDQVCVGWGAHLQWRTCRRQMISCTDLFSLATVGADARPDSCFLGLMWGRSYACRCIAVHPVLPYLLSSSDDMLIKLWDWDKVRSSSAVL